MPGTSASIRYLIKKCIFFISESVHHVDIKPVNLSIKETKIKLRFMFLTKSTLIKILVYIFKK